MAKSKSRPESNRESVERTENCCSQTFSSPSNLPELKLFCKEERAKISRCANLIETYPKRLTAVIAAKGGTTKY